VAQVRGLAVGPDEHSGRVFKDMFRPDWCPRYLAAPSVLPPLLALTDAARLIGGKAAVPA
jgi:lysylphosphatidylglycerol synthetase-like protein (DUF2156 family)